jgi:hypothetical protein
VNDFDMLHIIRKLRLHKTQLKTLLTKSERKMSKDLARKAIMAETTSSGFPEIENLQQKVNQYNNIDFQVKSE